MLKTLTILVCCIALFVIGWWLFRTDPMTTVSVIHPQRGRIESVIRVTGKVINDRTVTLTALVDGQIQSMQVQKGDQVKAGQVLALLDEREADALLAKAEAEHKRELQAVNEALRKLKRVRTLSRSGHAAAQLLDDTEAEWQASQARLQVARANLQVAQIHREKTQVNAPFAGVITEKTTEVGQWLEAGEDLFTLVAHEGREIEVNVDAGDSGTIYLQQAVTLSCDAYPGR
ncbi:MAG: efflux RND transporter periplasmic adaptor subunit, partial [Methylococcales bacterium]|nr:efflux RND transporter periplasmic adaptor subunit [Methylococcales bacterium]